MKAGKLIQASRTEELQTGRPVVQLWVNIPDKECAVYVDYPANKPLPLDGDLIEWDTGVFAGKYVRWTPAAPGADPIMLRKIGYAFDPAKPLG